ncbi:MAG: exonuclease domain-containing protein, partial [Bacteroidia bacterium]
MNFIAIDFETANNARSSICSMGAAIVQNGKLTDTAHFYIKPTPNFYNSFNTQLHGISDSDTRNEGTFGQQW